MSKNSQLNVTMDVYSFKNGLCWLEETGKQMETGALQGDNYCQMFLNVDMADCNGCPDYARRIEVYSNKDTGCGTEFYIDNSNNDNEDNDNDGDSDNSNSGNNNSNIGQDDGSIPPIEESAS